MKLTEMTLGKKVLLNIGNFSNVTAEMSMTCALTDGEKPDYEGIWKRINYEIEEQLKEYRK